MRALMRASRLDWYIFRQLLVGLVAITLGLVALTWMTQSLRFIQLIIQHGLSPVVFVHLTGLLLPSFFAVILPITLFIIILFVYSRLAADRELTVMRAAGCSDLAIARPALALTVLVMAVCWVLNVWLVPSSLQNFSRYEFEIRNKIAAFLLEPGVFTPIEPHVTVYVQRRTPAGVLQGIMIYDSRDKAAPSTILARSGRLVRGESGPLVVLRDGMRQQLDPKTQRLNTLSFKRDLIDISQGVKTDPAVAPKTSEASMAQLLHPDPTKVGVATRKKWHAEVARRLAGPFAVLAYAMVALFAALGAKFRRFGGLAAPASAVAGVIMLVALNVTVGNLASRDNALIPLIWLVECGPILLIPAGFWAWRRWALRATTPALVGKVV
ncbi:MAG: LPS export ABC transporter permease LptF [Acidiphilium sp. 21-60-14]|nr:MAG: LPS export ABC transporter permease LptF [Acidiphilium sp. 21-60-14]OYV90355.1 MAG: LPS export ABC transporter permease LptF [Acidiphilium sp. 37-60-79]OZB41577.1 MAG: LPS export ABC transporter permease LptF [Acidiphilium sp. 34-60-192]